jgi:hypothetical protein
MSVSAPFHAPSVQLGSQVLVTALHAPEAQSSPVRQPAPAWHFEGHPPPQSLPVSTPFFTPSEHEGAAQRNTPFILRHTPLVQSEALKQGLPAGQGAEQTGPQSTPASPPF